MSDYLLREMVYLLPRNRRWTIQEREAWFDAMRANVDLVMLHRQRIERKPKQYSIIAKWHFLNGN